MSKVDQRSDQASIAASVGERSGRPAVWMGEGWAAGALLELFPEPQPSEPMSVYREQASPFDRPEFLVYVERLPLLSPRGQLFGADCELRWEGQEEGYRVHLLCDDVDRLPESLRPLAGRLELLEGAWSIRRDIPVGMRDQRLDRGFFLWGRYQASFLAVPASAPWDLDGAWEASAGRRDVEGRFVEVGVPGAGRYQLPRGTGVKGGCRAGVRGVQYLCDGIPRFTRLAGLEVRERNQ